MKKLRYILPILALFTSVAISAQRIKKQDKDKIKAYKIAYITDQLNLSSSEAQKFWPIYNRHEETLDKLRKEENSNIRKLLKNNEEIDGVSESDAESIVTSMSKIIDRKHSANREYFQKLKKVLPFKKILKLHIAERQFKRKLFENLKKRRKRLKEEKRE